MGEMDDLEIVRRCAEAMGIKVEKYQHVEAYRIVAGPTYDPLHDAAQAFALVERFRFGISPPGIRDGVWAVSGDHGGTLSTDLKRAICLAVASGGKEG